MGKETSMKRRDFFGFMGKAAVAAPIVAKGLTDHVEAKPLPKVMLPDEASGDRVLMDCVVSCSPVYGRWRED
jgi:hypothetical protein